MLRAAAVGQELCTGVTGANAIIRISVVCRFECTLEDSMRPSSGSSTAQLKESIASPSSNRAPEYGVLSPDAC